MARIIENELGRRLIKINTDDVISIVKEYQKLASQIKNPNELRSILNNSHFFLPEDL